MAPAPSKLFQSAHATTGRTKTESPRICRTHGGTQPVPNLRTRMGQEMEEEFITADFDTFVKSYLPFVPDNDVVDACFQQMQEDRTPDDPIISELEDVKTGEKFFGFSDFYMSLETEKQRFSHLTEIADHIGRATVEGREQAFKFLDCPNIGISSDIEGSTHRNDACFVPIDFEISNSKSSNRTKGIHTAQIAVVGEWKKEDGKEDVRVNSLQVLSANVQIMNDDPSRMHGFGISIEGNYLTLWFFCRSHSAVSERVDFVKNPKLLIIAFMSFMFATREEMGYDSTITRHANGDFTYAVEDRFFRTVHSISEYRSNNITGRMTRVWSVREVDSSAFNAKDIVPSRQYVLKDVWLEDRAHTEKEIQSSIFRDIEEFWARKTLPPEFEPLHKVHADLVISGGYKKYFLSIEADSTGRLTKAIASRKPKPGMFNKPISTPPKLRGLSRNLFFGSDPSKRCPANPTKSMDSSNSSCPNTDRDYARRKQYRVVFNEECVTVGDLKTLGEVAAVIKQTLIPLQLMFCAGWVHRDISSGNVLAYRSSTQSDWTAKLSDLEYAKKFPPPAGYRASKDPKTGTPFFMPHEILAESYLFQPDTPQKKKRPVDQKFLSVGGKHPPQTKRLPLMHNFQHDLESLFWMLLWTLLCRIPYERSQNYGSKIFKNTIRLSPARSEAFNGSIFETLLIVLPHAARTLACFIEVLRGDLQDSYSKLEKAELVCSPLAYIEIHSNFEEDFEFLSRGLDTSWRDIELEHADMRAGHPGVLKPPSPGKVKRPHSEDYYRPERQPLFKRAKTVD